VLRVLVWYTVLTLLNSLFSLVLMGEGNEKAYTRALVAGSLAAAGLVAAGAVLGGAPGAAAGVVAGEALTAWLVFRNVDAGLLRGTAAAVLRPLAGAALMAAAGGAAASFGPVPAAAAGLAAYGLFALAGGLFAAEEVRWLKERVV
jgi:O-antigen/teichoic acid export membrane protein